MRQGVWARRRDSRDSSMRWSPGQVNMIVIKFERNECHAWEEESSGNVGH